MKCYNFFISWWKIEHGLHGNVTAIYIGILRIESCLMDEIARKLVPVNGKSVGRNIEIDYYSGKSLGFPSIILGNLIQLYSFFNTTSISLKNIQYKKMLYWSGSSVGVKVILSTNSNEKKQKIYKRSR